MYGNAGADSFYIDDLDDVIIDAGAGDTALVSVNGYSVPSCMTNVLYGADVEPLPYFINALKSNGNPYWGKYGQPQTLTYSFALAPGSEQGFQLYTDDQQDAVVEALGKYSAFSNVSFTEVADSADADIRFFRDDLTSAGLSASAAYTAIRQSTSTSQSSSTVPYFVMTTTTHASVHIDVNDFGGSDSLNPGGYGFQVLLHEIGHALGMKHPFEGSVVLPPDQENTDYSVMSYTMLDYDLEEPAILDIAAIHYFFGVNSSARSGNDAYGFGDHYIWDGSGIDSFSAAAETGDAYVNLNPGSWLHVGLKNAANLFADGQAFVGFGTMLENAEGGSGNDRLIGNGINNLLYGIVGNDSLRGGAGNDTLAGGPGEDTALYTGSIDEYEIVYDALTDGYTVTDLVDGRDGADTVRDVERFSFNGFEETFPEIALFTPANGAVGVGVETNITLAFSEAITSGNGFIDLLDSTGALAERFDVSGSDRLAFTGDTLTINPTAGLESGTTYNLVISKGSILDRYGFAYDPEGDVYQFATEESGVIVEGVVTFWNDDSPLAGTEMRLVSKPDETVEDTASSSEDGTYSFGRVEEGLYGLDAGKPVDSRAENAIQFSDALVALKLALGRSPSSEEALAPTACQLLAADVDQNGSVEASDGVEILKMVLGLSSAVQNKWLIVPESVASETMSNDEVDWSKTVIPDVTLDHDTQIDLIGVLVGDVDGSWSALAV